jgi:hypothetical protein
LLKQFISYLEEQGCSKNTIRCYVHILKVFQDQDIKNIKLKDLEMLLSDNLSTAAIQQAAFKKYFGWLHKQGYIALNPTEGLLVPRAEYNREPISPEDKEIIMDAIEKLPAMPRASSRDLFLSSAVIKQILLSIVPQYNIYPDYAISFLFTSFCSSSSSHNDMLSCSSNISDTSSNTFSALALALSFFSTSLSLVELILSCNTRVDH